MQSYNDAIKTKLSEQTTYLYQLANEHINETKSSQNGWTLQPGTNPDWVKTWVKTDENKRVHRVINDSKYHVTTYELIGNEDDKKNKLVGTNGRTIVKLLNDKSYDFVKTEDFIDRANLLYQAATEMISKDITLDRNHKIKFLTWLKAQQTKLKTDLSNCTIDPGIIQEIPPDEVEDIKQKKGFFSIFKKNKTGKEDSREKHFDEPFNKAELLLKQAVVNIAESMKVQLTQYKNKERSEIVHAVAETEKEIITKRGRPFVLKVGHIGKDKKNSMVSLQVPLGTETIPSSQRKGNFSTKLSNHVRDGSGYIDGEGKVQLAMIVDGHCSYPPIGEKDEMKRRYIAFLAVQEKISLLAADIIKTNPESSHQPITIPLSAMMMLTPAVGKKTERIVRGSESEHGQLSDTSYALEMLRNKKQPFSISIKREDGSMQDIKVNIDVSYMNIPVNVGKLKHRLIKDQLQTTINARGFYQFSKSMDEARQKLAAQFTQNNLPIPLTLLKTNSWENNQEIQNAEMVLISAENNSKEKLITCYANLEDLLKRHNINPDGKLDNEYHKIKSEIIKIQSELNKKYVDFQTLMSKHYDPKKLAKSKKQILSIIKKLSSSEELITLRELPNSQLDNQSRNQLREQCINQLRFLKCQELFYSKDENSYTRKRNAYQFHVNYLLANEGTGRSIEGFCKSAEDRTGWLRISMLAHVAFVKEHGHDPDLNDSEDKKIYDRFFATKAHELSASLENTKYNSESRGLQVSKDFTSDLIGMSMGKKMAGLAKGITKELDKLKPVNLFHDQSVKNKITSSIFEEENKKSIIETPAPLSRNGYIEKTPGFIVEINKVKKTIPIDWQVDQNPSRNESGEPYLNVKQTAAGVKGEFKIFQHKLSVKENQEATFKVMLDTFYAVHGANKIPLIRAKDEEAKRIFETLCQEMNRKANICLVSTEASFHREKISQTPKSLSLHRTH